MARARCRGARTGRVHRASVLVVGVLVHGILALRGVAQSRRGRETLVCIGDLGVRRAPIFRSGALQHFDVVLGEGISSSSSSTSAHDFLTFTFFVGFFSECEGRVISEGIATSVPVRFV